MGSLIHSIIIRHEKDNRRKESELAYQTRVKNFKQRKEIEIGREN